MVIPGRTGFWLAAIAALALAGASCGSTQHAIDTELAKCLPADTLVAAGVNLDQARQSPLFAKLPASAHAIADPFDRATYLLVAFNGKELITAARGDFRGNAPAGTTLLSANVAIAGRHPAGSGAPPADLLTQAESVAAGHAIWIIARGTATLPLTGNAQNINRLLHMADTVSLGADLHSGLTLDSMAQCSTPEAARGFEESLRALLSLTVPGLRLRQPELAALLQSATIERRNRAVHAALSAGPGTAAQLLDFFGR